MIESFYWETLRAFVENGTADREPKRKICASVAQFVQDAAARDERWAIEVLDRWIRRSADADYTRIHKALHTTTYIRHDGKRVRKTTSFSRPQRSSDTGAIIGHQMEIVWEMDQNAVAALRRDIFDAQQCLTDQVTVLDQILGAMGRHPDCVTAREAWEADGREIGKIDPEQAA
jgi:hypothetical protein